MFGMRGNLGGLSQTLPQVWAMYFVEGLDDPAELGLTKQGRVTGLGQFSGKYTGRFHEENSMSWSLAGVGRSWILGSLADAVYVLASGFP